MTRDLRDPQAIGVMILREFRVVRRSLKGLRELKLSDYCSNRRLALEGVPLVLEADGRYVGPLERYGDPRARHEAGK